MVVNKTDYMLELAGISLNITGLPDDARFNVERELVERAPGSLELCPEFRTWCRPNGLLSFGEQQPTVPQGVTLDELVHYNNGMFLLTPEPYGSAHFREPFFDYMTASSIKQYVVVFVLNGVGEMTRLSSSDLDRHVYRAPKQISVAVADSGPVLHAGYGTDGDTWLALGRGWMPGGGLRWHTLGAKRFAIEQKVLEIAGIDINAF